jgi:hypothetical protein
VQRDNHMKLSWSCLDQLFRQEVENADDVRLNVRLYAKCMPDKRKVWLGVGAGSGCLTARFCRIPHLLTHTHTHMHAC